MGTASTVNSPSILVLQTGKNDLDGLVAEVDKGILITGFNGGNCNSSTETSLMVSRVSSLKMEN